MTNRQTGPKHFNSIVGSRIKVKIGVMRTWDGYASTLMHELGHCLGITHMKDKEEMMAAGKGGMPEDMPGGDRTVRVGARTIECIRHLCSGGAQGGFFNSVCGVCHAMDEIERSRC